MSRMDIRFLLGVRVWRRYWPHVWSMKVPEAHMRLCGRFGAVSDVVPIGLVYERCKEA